ncbi:MAG: recombination regulator RecX [Proteobacteria bacterium]|nr:recombination regulator RecX [Pseudomonadota bacterium]
MKPVHEEIRELRPPEDGDGFACPKRIRKKAMDLLARRDYGRAELVKKLADKGYQRAVVEEQIGVLSDEGLQSDTRFAGSFVQSRIGQGKGPVRIRAELAQRGIRDGVVEGALEEAGVDWYALAVAERRKKFGAEAPAAFSEKARQMRFLQYRGFEHEHIQSAF